MRVWHEDKILIDDVNSAKGGTADFIYFDLFCWNSWVGLSLLAFIHKCCGLVQFFIEVVNVVIFLGISW